MEENQQEIAGKQIGTVSSYFSHVGVAAIKLSDNLKVGDKIKIKGSTTDLETSVEEIQIERKPVQSAKASDHIGIKVPDKVRPNDKVFLLK
jgi:ribosomal 50S subunit-recycling heat shock protein